jgi:uracil-DNA glycosylase family 4
MIEEISNTEVLRFYLDNDLSEILSEKGQNRFLEKEEAKKTAVKTVKEEKKQAVSFFSKPIRSNSEALSNLAKKSQAIDQSGASQEAKFTPLNDILKQAEKAAGSAKTLLELRKAVEDFDGCNLKKMATNTVFCDGNPGSKVMVIGEAPGNHEDLQGVPFCDDSGKLLDDMFGAINMTRAENFYVTNVIFWRPPGNRRPTSEELAICKPFVERHIELMNPEVLVLVGATAMAEILGLSDPITKIRGTLMDFSPKFLSKKIKVFTILHPSYLMRQASKKKVAWKDMLLLESFLSEI